MQLSLPVVPTVLTAAHNLHSQAYFLHTQGSSVCASHWAADAKAHSVCQTHTMTALIYLPN